jgi:two-component system CheB/CheR fusion protein
MAKRHAKTGRRAKPSTRARRARRNIPPTAKPASSDRLSFEFADSPPEFNIVGVGASAGGFEAFAQVLDSLPADPKLAIVFVQHLAPKHASALPSLLTSHSRMPVTEAVEGVRLEPNRVYVVPPNVQMELVDGHLHLGPRPEDRTQYTPIDFFFRSLARTLRNHAIGVVLSGTASDGALGVREIKSMGGITVAQDPKTAKYDGMPRSAIATQMIDLVLTPKEIATKLVQIAKHPYSPPSPAGSKRHEEPAVSEEQLERVLRLLLPACGVDFMHYKTPTIVRRLFRRMTLLRMADAEAYITYLEQRSDEVVNLHNDLLIHVTHFFREPDSFAALAADVLPNIDIRPDVPVRAWVAGCATGEEVYSLAILVHETLGDRLGEVRVQIFGTDVSDSAVEYARHGLYPTSIASDVSPERLRRFFTKIDGGYRVTKPLRDMCVFARQDLTRDPPFSRLDLICCRNVLIYLDTRLQKKLLSTFHYSLKPHGVLLLGHAESIGHNSELFALMDKKHRIFKKKPGAIPIAAELDVATTPIRADPMARPTSSSQAPTRAVLTEANRIVLDRYAPPSVLVDQNFHVVQFNGQTGLYLEPSPGEPSFHVLKLAREGLLHGLRTALQTARKTRKPTRRQGLRVRGGTQWHDIDLEVLPVVQQSQTFYLVLFEQPQPKLKKDTKPAKAGRRSGAQARRVTRLEEELAATREYLQSTIQEIEAANEELQSANEEILSSNEELQSTNEELDTAKEELQSTNEELNTVNDELHGRNEELTRVNADLLNLLASVQIAIVIVSRDLRIRRFTPMAEKVFNLIPTDLGRPFSQISPNIVSPELLSIVTDVIDSVTPAERTVYDNDGKAYSLRIRPYKSADNRIEGAVIALVDLEPGQR